MASFNKVILVGNLTRDPETRTTPKGVTNSQFGLAVNRKFRDASGSTREETTFVDIEAWDKQAENITKFCFRGSPLMVEGRLKLDTWVDKSSGQNRSKLKVVLENFQLLGNREDSNRHSGAKLGDQSAPPSADPGEGPHAGATNDEDVPF